jgi:hypothetical protein
MPASQQEKLSHTHTLLILLLLLLLLLLHVQFGLGNRVFLLAIAHVLIIRAFLPLGTILLLLPATHLQGDDG